MPASSTRAKPCTVAPLRALTAALDILLFSVFVKEDLIDDFRFYHGAIDLGEVEHLAHAVGAIVDKAHGDTTVERGRVVGRGDPALHVALTIGVGAFSDGI